MAGPVIEPTAKKALRVRSKARAIIDEVAENADAPVKWPTPIKYALDALTYKQRRCVVYCASGMTQVDAYKHDYAVASDKNIDQAYSEASMVAKNQKVSEARLMLEEWLDKVWLLEAQTVIEWGLSTLHEEATQAEKASDRIAATVAIMKAHGAFVSRSEVRHIHSVDTSSLDSLFSGVSSLIGLSVPIPQAQIEQANVANKGLIDAEYTVSDPIGIGTHDDDSNDQLEEE